MIRLTKPDGTSYYFNPDQVVEVDTYNQKTTISTICTHGVFVTETPKEVVRKIMEYKLLNTKLTAFYNVHAIDPEDERAIIDQIRIIRISLDNLAGLEDNQDG